ncbi:MAG: hypothetical protein ACRDR6_24345 [Pseudonocardiaceae bacterium]
MNRSFGGRPDSSVRRVAEQDDLRLMVESECGQKQVTRTTDEARESLDAVVKDKLDRQSEDFYLELGRITDIT